jgi:hypothetical protein
VQKKKAGERSKAERGMRCPPLLRKVKGNKMKTYYPTWDLRTYQMILDGVALAKRLRN